MQLLRDPARARRVAQPQRRRRARARSAAASSRATARSCSPGINLGCFRDRDAGYDLPRLVREAGATPGLDRLRLSSIEINHVTTSSSRRCARRRPSSRHLHVPLQSGDDGVLRAMRRRYTTATYLRRLEPLAGEFNLTSDVIVGFPAEDEAAFAQHARDGRARRADEGARLPVLAAPGHGRPRGDDPVPPQVKKERGARLRALAHELELRRWHAKLGSDDVVLVDRPGRGYGDDYSPFLVDAPVGELVRVRASAVTEEGILAVAA